MGLEKKGWSVTVAALKVDHRRYAALAERLHWNIEVKQIPASRRMRRWQRIGFILRRLWASGGLWHLFSPWVRDLALASEGLDGICSELKPDLIHAHFGPNGIIGAFAVSQFKIPLIVDFHGYDVTVVPQQHGWSPYRCVLSHAHAHATVHSRFVEARVQKHVAIPTHRVTLGVDFSLFRAPRRSQRWPRHVRLLTVGRLVEQKGHHIALEALALLRHQCSERILSLEICGDGPLRSWLEERACKLDVQDMVSFAGPLAPQDVARRMADADVLLVPSIPLANGSQEAFCRVAVEGMAMGMAVVGTDTGGLAETIGEGGRIVQAGQASAMASAVANLLETSTPVDFAGKAMRRAQLFSIESMWEQYDAVTHQACRRDRTPA